MFPRLPTRARWIYNLVLGSCLTISGTIGFVLQSHADGIAIILGIALVTSGLVLRARWKAEEPKRSSHSTD